MSERSPMVVPKLYSRAEKGLGAEALKTSRYGELCSRFFMSRPR
jgi:hypothetical protein